jgi:hypothetical protein
MSGQLKELIPILIPAVVILLIIMVAAFLDLRKQTVTRGPKWMWAALICIPNLIGPLAYFLIGRKEE